MIRSVTVGRWVWALFLLTPSASWAQDEPGGAKTEDTVVIPPVLTTSVTPEIPSSETGTTAVITTLEDRTPPPPPCPESFAASVYQKGFDQLSAGRPQEAKRHFDALLRSCPDHPVAPEMRRLAEAQIAQAKVAPPPEETTLEPSMLAWGELLAFQTLHGVTQGILVCAAAGCEDVRLFAVSGFLGASLGAGLSAFGFDRLYLGQGNAINSGTGWGIWNAIALAVITEPNERAGPAMASGMLVGGTALGVAAALLLEPRQGAVSFANSTGIWLGVITLFFGIAAEADFEETIMPIEMVVTNVGLLGGAIASQYLDISRGRVLLIDAGGILGGLIGFGAAALIGGGEISAGLLGTLTAVSTVGGLVGTYFATAGLDRKRAPDVSGIWIGPHGRGIAVGASF